MDASRRIYIGEMRYWVPSQHAKGPHGRDQRRVAASKSSHRATNGRGEFVDYAQRCIQRGASASTTSTTRYGGRRGQLGGLLRNRHRDRAPVDNMPNRSAAAVHPQPAYRSSGPAAQGQPPRPSEPGQWPSGRRAVALGQLGILHGRPRSVQQHRPAKLPASVPSVPAPSLRWR
jgi:hypothetical protein